MISWHRLPALTVSVCQNVSTTGHLPWPTASWYQCHASGLIGSPTVPRILRVERSYLMDTQEISFKDPAFWTFFLFAYVCAFFVCVRVCVCVQKHILISICLVIKITVSLWNHNTVKSLLFQLSLCCVSWKMWKHKRITTFLHRWCLTSFIFAVKSSKKTHSPVRLSYFSSAELSIRGS